MIKVKCQYCNEDVMEIDGEVKKAIPLLNTEYVSYDFNCGMNKTLNEIWITRCGLCGGYDESDIDAKEEEIDSKYYRSLEEIENMKDDIISSITDLLDAPRFTKKEAYKCLYEIIQSLLDLIDIFRNHDVSDKTVSEFLDDRTYYFWKDYDKALTKK